LPISGQTLTVGGRTDCLNRFLFSDDNPEHAVVQTKMIGHALFSTLILWHDEPVLAAVLPDF
jgi:hypothetical protein